MSRLWPRYFAAQYSSCGRARPNVIAPLKIVLIIYSKSIGCVNRLPLGYQPEHAVYMLANRLRFTKLDRVLYTKTGTSKISRGLESDNPDDIISSMKRAARAGKVFIDWSQNNANKTTITPFSLRGKAIPTVKAPRTWQELQSKNLKRLEMREVLENVSQTNTNHAKSEPLMVEHADVLVSWSLPEGGRSKKRRQKCWLKYPSQKTVAPLLIGLKRSGFEISRVASLLLAAKAITPLS